VTAGKGSFPAVERLEASHETGAFDCGNEPLDRFLKLHAIASQKAESARTYVVCRAERRVIGYYSLAAGSAEHARVPSRVSRGLARHPVPVMLLARLAVDRSEQRRGLGEALLADALDRTARVADNAGIRALAVHVKDDGALAWYRRYDFEPSPSDPYQLFMLMKDLRALLGN